jgi:membrane protease YdiL (CAAX protease family)
MKTHQLRPTIDLNQIGESLLRVRWEPNRDTLVALGSYVLVVGGLLLAFQVFTTAMVAANFITFAIVTLAGVGVALPVLYTVLVRRRPLADVGITRYHLWISLGLGLALGLVTYLNTLALLNTSWSLQMVPLLAMSLTVGLFEAIFFRGWLQLRLESAFGLVPAVVLGALLYALYHVGYGMSASEITGLFVLGLVFAAVFRLTKNIAILWPFFTPVGGFYQVLVDGLNLPIEATYGFVIVLGMMVAVILVAHRLGAQRAAPAVLA